MLVEPASGALQTINWGPGGAEAAVASFSSLSVRVMQAPCRLKLRGWERERPADETSPTWGGVRGSRSLGPWTGAAAGDKGFIVLSCVSGPLIYRAEVRRRLLC
ncbi:hypothetical protein CSUI_005771 [Cystoisospora suis]|uniref:Uncharacterized protein n=1 Tax=Cystoisospora suis TaxID=483139 RepID=A0A2C6KSN4_9APIC|nr:hypothetical protein CSUI_005771 [Cystoisospora suis]